MVRPDGLLQLTARGLVACLALAFVTPARAATYPLVEGQDFMHGEYAETAPATAGDTLIEPGRHGGSASRK